MYTSWTGTNWVSQTVDEKGSGFGMVALDSYGNPHIAYKGDDGYTVKYTTRTGSNQNIQTVDTCSKVSFKLSFAIGKDDCNASYLNAAL